MWLHSGYGRVTSEGSQMRACDLAATTLELHCVARCAGVGVALSQIIVQDTLVREDRHRHVTTEGVVQLFPLISSDLKDPKTFYFSTLYMFLSHSLISFFLFLHHLLYLVLSVSKPLSIFNYFEFRSDSLFCSFYVRLPSIFSHFYFTLPFILE